MTSILINMPWKKHLFPKEKYKEIIIKKKKLAGLLFLIVLL